ncbi:CPBP family glutamic-type intramembrane protease [Dyella mobilis]|uniref:CPBP family intramembrane metalloprotease n=1 Tax=Dyella mobilis TaxID=1849582 RepID=A0ABS2KJ66_9GAMM|nr:CPBP family glutamic-type intramembrane protease [Dyella mobilis]MBM7131214.1 CPBP family intramembrane metalloprotease [Dyella mobilis]GLQ98850.1 abortive infection protein [Dyella mobilis]
MSAIATSTGKSHLKLALLLGVFAIIATLALEPYLDATEPATMAKVHVPFWIVAILQGGIPSFLLGWLGLILGSKNGLDAPWLRALVYRHHQAPALRAHWLVAVIAGLLSGVVVAALAAATPGFASPAANISPIGQAWRGALASLYGGTAEEILLRLFVVSLLVWLLSLFNKRQALSWMFVLAIVLAAVLFGIGHLPTAFAMGMAHTPVLIGRIILLNALVGLVTGTLFWKYGLEHAMLAHFCADLMLHVATPLIVHG